jgi:hypothetical protein
MVATRLSSPKSSPESFRGWNVPCRSPSRRVRYDPVGKRGYIVSADGQGVAPQITPFPPGQRLVSLGDADGRLPEQIEKLTPLIHYLSVLLK